MTPNHTVIIEQALNATPDKVWDAITNVEAMQKWYFPVQGFEPVLGNEFNFSGITPDDIEYVHLCKILELEPNKKLAYSWVYRDYKGSSVVEFEIISTDETSVLKFSHKGIDSFAENGKDFTIESFTNGWTEIITKSLVAYLGGI